MQSTSEAYKVGMRKTIRNRSYMRFVLGLINNDAQGAAALDSDVTYYSDPEAAISGDEVKQEYAAFDGLGAPLSASLVFLPKESEDTGIPFGGAFSTALVQASVPITWEFVFGGARLAIKGLTIDFGRIYPVDFTVSDDTGITVTVAGNDNSVWVTDQAWHEAGKITLTVIKMSQEGSRLGMRSILFGYGFRFETKDIFETSFNSRLSPISEEVPSFDFSISVKNHGGQFDVDNPDSALNFLQIGQECEVYYGYAVGDSIEWIPGTSVLLDSWSADREKAEFKASDILSHSNGIYGKGLYRLTTLYDLAEDVCSDAGLENYWIDPYLETVSVVNPMPAVSHPEALQIIANAARSILSLTRSGAVMIRSSFDPDVTGVSDAVEPYASAAAVVGESELSSVASFEPGFSVLDGSRIFRGDSIVAGYVSEDAADSSGTYQDAPTLTIQLEAAMQYTGFQIEFDRIYPDELQCTTYFDNVQVESFTVLPDGEMVTVSRELKTFDRLDITAVNGTPYTRVHINRVLLGDTISHHMIYRDMTDSPSGSTDDAVSRVDVVRTIYQAGPEEELVSDAVTVYPGDGIRTFSLSDPATDISVSVTGGIAEVLQTGAYQVVISAEVAVATELTVTITGKKLMASEQIASKKISDVGVVKSWSNPLISDYQHAADVAEWLADYYAGTTIYEVSYRGDPAFDVGDSIYQQISAGEIPVKIYEHKLSFNGALSGTLKTRRIINVDNT